MAVVEILLSWLVAGAALCGWGVLTARALGFRADGRLSLTYWLGMAATLGVLCVVCLFHAIDGTVLLLFLGTGAAGLALAKDERQQWWKQLRGGSRWLLLMLPILLWLADRARLMPQNGDSFVYHLQAVAWAERFRATPGLANLHDRLGFNDSTTLFLALLDHGPLANRAAHVANGLFLLPLFFRGVRALCRLAPISRRSRLAPTARDGFDAVLLIPAIGWALGMNLSSASPDLPVACLEATIASELAGCLGQESPLCLSALIVMGAGLLTIKLSALGFVAGLALPIVLLARRNVRKERLLGAIIVSAGFLVAWVARGVVLSGYPFYPSPFGALPVDWRVPLERAREEYGYVRGWGRRPMRPWRQVLASWDWLVPWWESLISQTRDVVVPVWAAIVLLPLAWMIRPRKPGAARPLLFALFVPPLVELAFWFATAPDMRFVGACFWLLPAASAAVLVSRGIRGPAAVALAGVVVALALWPFSAVYKPFGPHRMGFEDPNPPRTKPFVTRSGLALTTPASGSSCYESELLCAAWANDAIRLRDTGNIAAGFSVQEQAAK